MAFVTRTLAIAAALSFALLTACSTSPGPDAPPAPADDATPTAGATPNTPTPTPTTPAPNTPQVNGTDPARESVAVPGDAPEADLLDLVRRYQGLEADQLPDDTLYRDEPAGTKFDFTLIEPITPSTYQTPATLRHVGERSLWYIADDIDVGDDEVARAAARFDADVFPAVFATFAPGSEPPGKITVVVANLRGGVAGYFSGADSVPRSVSSVSNERAAIYVLPQGPLDSAALMGTLAHELQHMAHWLVDGTEATWVNEGLSEYATRSLGLPALPYFPYLRSPDVSLINWPIVLGASLPNYAGSSLFISYLAERTGEENLHLLVAHSADGIKGVEAYLDVVQPSLGFEALFADWLVANAVDADEGPYAHPGGGQVPFPQGTITGPTEARAEVPQYGAYYLRVEPRSPLDVTFEGLTTTPLIAAPAHSGDFCWWGNAGDSIDSTLTRSFDLRDTATATLRFQGWYEIEDGWDYAYVSVSTDGGRRWEALAASGTDTLDPVGAALGPGFTGESRGWVESVADLTPFVGREVLVRFEYVTDEALHGSGWCVDDIEVPEVGFSDDVESLDAGWASLGFFRAPRQGIPQRFVVQLITGQGNDAIARRIEVGPDGGASFTVDEPGTLVISGLTPKARIPAEFTIEFTSARVGSPA